MGADRISRTARDDGASAVEYTGLIVVAAVVVLVLAQLTPSVSGSVSDALCRLFGTSCGDSSEVAAVRTGGDRPGGPTPGPTGQNGPLYLRPPGGGGGQEEPLPLVPLDDLDLDDVVDFDNCRGPLGGDLCLSGDVTFSEQISGVLVFLYEICDGDMACVRREARAILNSLEKQFPDLDADVLLDALKEDELPEKIREVRDKGGCLNLRMESGWGPLPGGGLKWRHRSSDSGDDCFGGAALHFADVKPSADRKYEITAGRNGVKVTLKVGTTDLLRSGLDLSGGDVGGLLELIKSQGSKSIPTEGLGGDLWQQAVSPENHDELAEAIRASRDGDTCLTVEVFHKEDGGLDVQWATTRRGRGRC